MENTLRGPGRSSPFVGENEQDVFDLVVGEPLLQFGGVEPRQFPGADGGFAEHG